MKMRLPIALGAAVLASLASFVQAEDFTWIGGASNEFHNGSNWNRNYGTGNAWQNIWWDSPTTNRICRNTAVFSGSSATYKNAVVSFSDLSFGGLRVEQGAAGYSITSNVAGRGVSLIAPTGQTSFSIDINENFSLGSSAVLFSTLRIYNGGEIKVADGKYFNIYAATLDNGTKSQDQSGNTLVKTGNLVKTGEGTLRLHFTGAGSYTSQLAIREGAIEIATDKNLGVTLPGLSFDTDSSDVQGLGAAADALNQYYSLLSEAPAADHASALNAAWASLDSLKNSIEVGTLKISDNANVAFSGSSADNNRIEMAANPNGKTGRILLGSDSSLHFSGNTFPDWDDGGAIYTGLGNTLFLQSDGTSRFYFENNVDSNHAVDGGGIYNEGTMTVEYATFANNETGAGGGIFNSGAMMLDHAEFSGNTAIYGAAVYNSGSMSISNSVFSGNSSTSDGMGGAIYVNGGVLVMTDCDFTNNTAGSSSYYDPDFGLAIGGAIAVEASGVLMLHVTEGHTSLFSGNKADGASNSIDIMDGSLVVNAEQGGVLDMRDSIRAASLNGTADISVIGEGIWKLGGTAELYGRDYGASFTVEGGTLYLYREGEVQNGSGLVKAGNIYLHDGNADFTLGADATLAVGGGNTLSVDGLLTLESGSTFSFDLEGAVDGGLQNSPLLTILAGDLDAGETISILLETWAAGTFTLISNQHAAALSDSDFILQYGEQISSRQKGEITIGDGVIQITTSDNNNTTLTWTGQNGRNWNTAQQNWTDGALGALEVNTFMDGDKVVFDGRDNGGNVVIAAGGVQAETVEASGGKEYNYQGGELAVASSADDTAALSVSGDNTKATFNNKVDISAEGQNSSAVRVANNAVVEFKGETSIKSSNGSALAIDGATVSIDSMEIVTLKAESDQAVVRVRNGGRTIGDAVLDILGSLIVDGQGTISLLFKEGSQFEGYTSVNTALPPDVAELSLSMESSTWIVTGDSSLTSLIDNGSTFTFELASTADYATIAANQLSLFGSNIKIVLDDLYTAKIGDTFQLFEKMELFTLENISFDFDDAWLPGYLKWDVSSFHTDGYISVVAIPEPATAALGLAALTALMAGRRRSWAAPRPAAGA